MFLSSTPIGYLCTPDDGRPAGETLLHDYFGMGSRAIAETGTVEFQLPYGEWIRLLRRQGLHVEDLIEIQAPADGHSDWPFFPRQWSRRWPSEHMWVARKH